MRRRLKLSVLALLTLSAAPGHADLALSAYRVGAVLGSTKLYGDPGNGQADSAAYGIVVGSHVIPELAVDLDIMASSSSNVDHRQVNLGAEYFFFLENEHIQPRISLGLSRITNTLKSIDLSANTFGLFAGVGIDYVFNPNWRLGAEFRYQRPVETETRLLDGSTLKTIQASHDLLLRLIYEFNSFGLE